MLNKYMSKKNKSFIINLCLIAIVISLTCLPLLLIRDGEFGGADGEAKEAILEINPEYKPWVSSILEPKSGEIESMLFSLQAAIGSGIIFYGLGYMKGKAKKEEVIKE